MTDPFIHIKKCNQDETVGESSCFLVHNFVLEHESITCLSAVTDSLSQLKSVEH
jgi:hypothetical protein